MRTKPIIALDLPNKKEVFSFLEDFGEERLFLKIGIELFYSEGPEFVREVREKGHHIFLDLKLHDIPNTVYRAMKVLAGLDLDMINVHAAGGRHMMEIALKGLEEGTPNGTERPLLIAVTQLTSTTENIMQRDQLIERSLEESVVHYAKAAFEAGLDGVVCSAHEAETIHEATASDFLCVTPGIRPKGTAFGDQKRVTTPEEAKQVGSDYIVVGRPVTQVDKPVEAYQMIKKEWRGE